MRSLFFFFILYGDTLLSFIRYTQLSRGKVYPGIKSHGLPRNFPGRRVRVPRFHELCQGHARSGIVHGTAQHFMRHWQAKTRRVPSAALPYDRLLVRSVRSLARSPICPDALLLFFNCHHPRIWQVVPKKRPCVRLRTKRYFGTDEDARSFGTSSIKARRPRSVPLEEKKPNSSAHIFPDPYQNFILAFGKLILPCVFRPLFTHFLLTPFVENKLHVIFSDRDTDNVISMWKLILIVLKSDGEDIMSKKTRKRNTNDLLISFFLLCLQNFDSGENNIIVDL